MSTTYFDRERGASYDRRATRLLGGLYRRVAADVAAVAGPGAVVLEFAPGPGRLLHEPAARRTDLVLGGVDVSTDMVALARAARRPPPAARRASRITFEVGDVTALPRPDDGVDVVVSTLSLREWPDRRRAVVELGRVLRPGGVPLVYDFRFARVEPELFSDFVDVRRVPVRPEWWPVAVFVGVRASAV
ncbi:methyltransferase family protein [Saccharothrix saharensis]|uniref:Methyltransferase family protein n=1 Tax=Saccharothrix saharensis TaxID=571190 RepID=A0A543J4Z3_9PSEU|nr:class I SAM-dependent methyltransferase [Saccharothrix saharensis]TQM77896.1 methyltransferase family protein [Saccharothrix saharensis]